MQRRQTPRASQSGVIVTCPRGIQDMNVLETSGADRDARPIPPSAIDQLLSAQLIIAWAGEKGGEDERRLGWWRTDLLSDFGGRHLLSRLVPQTAEWAVLQAVREAARRTDESAREQGHDSDLLISLYSLGFEIDERTDERLQEWKRSGKTPSEALPSLQPLLGQKWTKQGFIDWVEGHGKADFTVTASGRRLKGKAPSSLDMMTRRLIAALLPIAADYPLPHFKGGS